MANEFNIKNGVIVPIGTVGAPSISFAGDGDTGMYHSSGDTLDFSTNSTRRLQINSAGNVWVTSDSGYLMFGSDLVGIGRTDTNEITLSVNGGDHYRFGATRCKMDYPIYCANGSASAPTMVANSDTDTGIYFSGSDGFSIAVGGTVWLTMADTPAPGNVTFTIPSDITDTLKFFQIEANSREYLTITGRGVAALNCDTSFQGTTNFYSVQSYVGSYDDVTAAANTAWGTTFEVIGSSNTDHLWVGMANEKFTQVYFYLSAPAEDSTLLVEYWDGDSWETLTVSDGTLGMTQSGLVFWAAPGDWAKTTVNGSEAYYVRFSDAVGAGSEAWAYSVVPGGDVTLEVAPNAGTGDEENPLEVSKNGRVRVSSLVEVMGEVASASNIYALDNVHSFYTLTGITATILHGISPGEEGQRLLLYNSTGATLTVKHMSVSAAYPAKIVTMTGADVTTSGSGMAEFIYNGGNWLCLYVTS